MAFTVSSSCRFTGGSKFTGMSAAPPPAAPFDHRLAPPHRARAPEGFPEAQSAPQRPSPFRWWRRPRQDFKLQVLFHGSDHVPVGRIVDPARMAKLPRFQVAFLHAPAGHLGNRPLGSQFVVGGARDARAEPVGERVEGLQDPRMFEFFASHLRIVSEIDILLREDKSCSGKDRYGRGQNGLFMIDAE